MSLLDTASLIVTPNGYNEGKLYSVIPSDGSGDLSVTRATTATRVNSAGLVELVPYNLLGYSEDFTNVSWLKGASTITGNTTTAPNGTLTADTFTGNGASDLHIVLWQTDVIGVGNTISVYAKKNTNDFLQIYTDFVNTDFANFDLANGTTGSVGSSVISSSIESVGNGWYRCSFVVGSSASKFVNFCLVTSATAGRAETNTLSTSVFLWGAQLNEGTIKPYQKTETRLNIPRLDYSNGTCPSILVEPQRTNLLTYSSSFDNAFWGKDNNGAGTLPVVTANYATAPDGTTSADRIQFTNIGGSGSAANYSLVGAFPLSLPSTGTATFYMKSNTSSNQNVLCYWGAGQGDVFQVTTEWQRFSLDNLSASGTSNLAIGTRGGTGNFYSGGDEVLDILVWGAQLEVGSYATSYIPTTSASVTRNADVISKTGISSLIGQTEGSVFWEGQISSTVGFPQLFDLNADGNKFIQIYNTLVSGVPRIGIYVQNVSVLLNNGNIATIAFNTNFRFALAYKNNDYVAYLNGVQVYSNTSTAVPPTSNFGLSAAGQSAETSGKNIKAAALWKTRLTNDELASLTTL